jgi:hypothetical protein
VSARTPATETAVMKGRDVYGPVCAGLRANGPATQGAGAPGLAQRAGFGRPGLGQKRQAGEGRGQHVVMDLRPDFGELGWEIGRGSAAQAVAAARFSVIVPMLVIG